MQGKMSYTINADDYGRDPATTKAILDCFEREWIDTTTLMVNMENSDAAAQKGIADVYRDKIGLHINLMEGKPLTKPILSESIFCTDGCFNKQFMRVARCKLYLKKREKQALQQEIEAQMERFLRYGFKPRYLDSHCSTHNLLPVLRIIKVAMCKFGFKTIRIARNINAQNLVAHNMYKGVVNMLIGVSGMKQSEYFTSFRDYILQKDIQKYRGKIEFMTHPLEENGKIVNLSSASFEDFFEFVAKNGMRPESKL